MSGIEWPPDPTWVKEAFAQGEITQEQHDALLDGTKYMPKILTPNQVNDAYWAKNRVAWMQVGCPRDRDIPVVTVTFRRRRSDLSYDYELDEEQATLLMIRLGAMLDRIRTGGGKRQTPTHGGEA